MPRDMHIWVERAPSSAEGCSRAMQQGLGILAEWSFARDTPLNRDKVIPIIRNDTVSLAADFGRGTVGVATYNIQSDASSTLFVDRLVVRRDLRGQGIGSVLLRHVLDTANELECDSVELYAINARAVKFYADRGFNAEDCSLGEMARMTLPMSRFAASEQVS